MSDVARRTAVSRRIMLSGLGTLLAMPTFAAAFARSAAEKVTLWGPPSGPSIILVHAIAQGSFGGIAGEAAFKSWRSPDELRAGLTSRTMELFILPTQVAANLYSRGLGIRLVNVMTNGLLYVIAGDEAITSLADLKGRSVAVPYRNDTPDLLFQRLLAARGLSADGDVALQFTGSPVEALQLVVMGRAEAALVPEPAASAAIQRAGAMGKSLFRVIDIQKEWGAVTGRPPVLPQAGLGVTADFLNRHPQTVMDLQQVLVEAAAAVNADPAQAAADAAGALEMPPAVLEQSIRWSHLVATPAREARASLEAMYSEIAILRPDVIGGRLPDSEFYL